jgi:mRNA interferase MazF
MVNRYDVHWVELDPTRGSEIAKTRPCVIVSPNELNKHLNTIIIIPITSTLRNYPYRVRCTLMGKEGEIVTDQIRSVDRGRLRGKIGELNQKEIDQLQDILSQMLCC